MNFNLTACSVLKEDGGTWTFADQVTAEEYQEFLDNPERARPIRPAVQV